MEPQGSLRFAVGRVSLGLWEAARWPGPEPPGDMAQLPVSPGDGGQERWGAKGKVEAGEAKHGALLLRLPVGTERKVKGRYHGDRYPSFDGQVMGQVMGWGTAEESAVHRTPGGRRSGTLAKQLGIHAPPAAGTEEEPGCLPVPSLLWEECVGFGSLGPVRPGVLTLQRFVRV